MKKSSIKNLSINQYISNEFSGKTSLTVRKTYDFVQCQNRGIDRLWNCECSYAYVYNNTISLDSNLLKTKSICIPIKQY